MSNQETLYAGMQERTYADQSVLQFKLDTEPLIHEFELFLTGKRSALKFDKAEGKYKEVEVQYGQPHANPEGVNSLLKLLISSVNPHNVQGNFTEVRYEDHISWRRKEITDAVVINRARWQINEDHMNMIIDNMMAIIEPFLTRLIDNLERESHGKSFGVKEVHTMDTSKQGLLPSLGGRR